MNELELKYGCNPNQKPASIYMRDGSDLPIEVLNVITNYMDDYYLYAGLCCKYSCNGQAGRQNGKKQ